MLPFSYYFQALMLHIYNITYSCCANEIMQGKIQYAFFFFKIYLWICFMGMCYRSESWEISFLLDSCLGAMASAYLRREVLFYLEVSVKVRIVFFFLLKWVFGIVIILDELWLIIAVITGLSAVTDLAWRGWYCNGSICEQGLVWESKQFRQEA